MHPRPRITCLNYPELIITKPSPPAPLSGVRGGGLSSTNN
ncbi:hypothetical protein HMPREF1556_00349 [Porphyromonas sp. oral taxon 278 str. W7784]|nr:hypothetical protein HMPREF1556_00349 [Porphyromonas sp. oral taxon 278 str. W7784]